MSGNKKALSSWSGYGHQGIVSLIVGVDKLIELKSSPEVYKDYQICMELEEDFDFRSTGADTPLEVHQVKAWKGSTAVYKYDSALKSLEEYKITDGMFLHSMEEIADWTPRKNGAKRYVYEKGKHSFGDRPVEILETKVGQLLNNKSQSAVKMLTSSIMANLTSKVCREHATKLSTADYDLRFTLADILGVLSSNPDLLKAQLFEIQSEMWKDFQMFQEHAASFQSSSPEQQANLIRFIGEIHHWPMDWFEKFVRTINPHKKSSNSFITHGLYTDQGWKEVFLEVLTRVVKARSVIMIGKPPMYRKGNEWYAPSLIGSENDTGISDQVQKNIQATPLRFEANVIITKGIDSHLTITPGITNVGGGDDSVTYPPELEKISPKTKPNLPKQVRLASRDDTINDLNS